jgi:DtxR family transcriptional regulator, Mn-dependent transcriptional regulator
VAGHLIDSTEMYLRTVLELEEEGIPALRARLAERLNLSAPSVSEGVARLQHDGLLVLDDDRTVHLTDEGRNLAVHVLRKHRLAERLLVDVLGVEHEHVHEEACRWEHVISDRVEQKLIEFLGNPTTSPYGNPIPGAAVDGGGDIISLSEADDGDVRIERISELLQGDRDVMQKLDQHDVRAGSTVAVQHAPDVVRVRAGADTIELSADRAKLIYVTQA